MSAVCWTIAVTSLVALATFFARSSGSAASTAAGATTGATEVAATAAIAEAAAVSRARRLGVGVASVGWVVSVNGASHRESRVPRPRAFSMPSGRDGDPTFGVARAPRAR